MDEIIFSSAIDIADAIRSKKVSCEEVLDAHLAQIEKHNASINAIITIDKSGAYQRAKEADEALANGEYWGPMHGVPMTLKDGNSTARMLTTAGFPPLANYVPEIDGTVAARLKSAGAIIFGKSNVPVMLSDLQTNNPIFGRTNNPWSLDRTPGGSSGGAVAALASGMVPCEVGSDIGGSIRVPAHFCGVFGLKTTEHRVSLHGHIPEPPGVPRAVRVIASIGPMARTVDDLALIYQLISGPDGHDTDIPPIPIDSIPDIDITTLKIAVASDFAGYPIAQHIKDAVVAFANEIDDFCQIVDTPSIPDFDYSIAKMIEPAEMAMEASNPQNQKSISLAHYLEALDRRDKYIVAWEQFFEEWDILICPPAITTAILHNEGKTPIRIDGKEVEYHLTSAASKPFNYTGNPAIVVPFTSDEHGLPIGIQIASKKWSESRLLGIAKAITKITGGFKRPPGY